MNTFINKAKAPTKKKFLADMEATSERLKPTDSGLRVYPYFLNFFQRVAPVTRADFVVAASFSYGWMPRMLKLRGTDDDWNKSANILNEAKERRITSEVALEFLSLKINNSLVGASKLLHFVNPEKHAIWDSRVFRYLTLEEPTGAEMRAIGNYVRFLEICDEIMEWREFPEAARKFQERLEQQCTPLRVIELTMWDNGAPSK